MLGLIIVGNRARVKHCSDTAGHRPAPPGHRSGTVRRHFDAPDRPNYALFDEPL
jgi:hypothetical protein